MFLSPLIKSPSLSYTILFAYLIIVLLHVKTKSTQNVLFRTTKHQRKKQKKTKKNKTKKNKKNLSTPIVLLRTHFVFLMHICISLLSMLLICCM